MPSFSDDLLDWYDIHARVLPWRISPLDRKAGILPDPYHVFLSELMLQQTTVATVGPYFETFLQKWPRVIDLAQATDDAVMRAWAGLGYYARARNLLKAARRVSAEYAGTFPHTENQLRTLPGIGAYTAAAIASIAFDKRAVVVDGNVSRIMCRVASIETPMEKAQTEIYATADTRTPNTRTGDYAQAIMDLGATICRPKKPHCDQCPVASYCQALTLGIVDRLPQRVAKKKRPERYGHAYIVHESGAIGYLRRPDKGLLGGLWAVPTSDWSEIEPEFAPPLKGNWQDIGAIRHIFTHFALNLRVYILDSKERPPMLTFMTDNELPKNELPTLFRKVISIKFD